MPRQRHDPSKNFVGFMVGDVAYAVRIELVREIVNPLDVIELPRSPEAVRGVADYRGVVVPVVDLRERFGLPAVSPTRRNKWIVVDVGRASQENLPGGPPSAASGGRFCALVVDAVTEVFGTGGAEVRPAPPLGGGDDLRAIAGVTTYGQALVFVIDVRAFSGIAEAAMKESRPPASLGL
ncbi:MAG TPA: chemotaxis protein CheW [Labilithrix sp.]|jgi:purine-binding chemotaxis protein CheW